MNRRKEIAIRAALGAGRRRVFQHLLIESLVLACAGGAAGVLLAKVAINAGTAMLANQIPRADEASIDARVLLFVLGGVDPDRRPRRDRSRAARRTDGPERHLEGRRPQRFSRRRQR